MPRPFVNERFQFTQPDGSSIELIGTGSQFSAVFEDTDGYVVVRDPQSQTYVYARLNAAQSGFEPTASVVGRNAPAPAGLTPHLRPRPGAAPRAMISGLESAASEQTRWQQRVSQKRFARRSALEAARQGLAFAPPSETTVGTFVGLCMLIEFPDVAATIPSAEVGNFCNQVGYSGFGNNGSVHDYFRDVSNGRLTYTNLVTAYYTAAHPRDHYTDETVPQGQRARELILEGIQNLVDNGFDFSALTTDDQGFVRALNVYYVGPRVNNWSLGLWPHAWRLAQPVTVAPGKRFLDYQFTNMGSELALGTFCHENGHMICDFPDLYDYGDDSFRSNGIGDYCLMCAGGRDDKNPVRVGAYLSRLAGWSHSVTAITPGLQGTLAADRDDFLIYPKSSSEYFLIENRIATGRDADLMDQGMFCWHCSETGSNEHQDGTATLHYECALVQADNERHLERGLNLGNPGDLYRQGSQTQFGDTTAPNSRWWDGTPSGLEITDIGAAGGDIPYRVPGPGGGDGDPFVASSTPGLAIPDNTFAGISDVIAVNHSGTVGALEVSVDISHTYVGDLVVQLRAPSGVAAVLHNRQGGGQNDLQESFEPGSTSALGVLLGQQMAGLWRLEVSDRASADTGRLNSWTLSLRTSHVPDQIAEAPGVTIPDNDPAGIVRTLTATGAGVVSALSVDLDITHTFIRDLVVNLVSPQGSRVTLHNRQGGSADNIIQSFGAATHPDLETFTGQPIGGDWRLEVADLEGQDTGKLNAWAVRFQAPANA